MIMMSSQRPPKIDIRRVALFERTHGIILPADYKQFLVEFNGGFPRPHEFENDFLKYHLFIRVFYSLDAYKPSEDIEKSMMFFAKGLRPGLMPIGEADSSVILLSYSNGSIYCSEEALDNPNASKSLKLIATSFSNLTSKQVPQKPLSKLDLLGKTGSENDLEEYLANGSNISDRNENGQTLIMTAAKHGNLVLVKACVKKGADMHGVVHFAARSGHVEVAKWLLANGASIDDISKEGQTVEQAARGCPELENYIESLR